MSISGVLTESAGKERRVAGMSETMYRIKKELKDQGISQKDFARMTGISESVISK